MTDADEFKMRQDMERATIAQQLLENTVLQAAWDALDAEYMALWRRTKAHETAEREKLWLAIQTAAAVQKHLETMVVNGHVASAQLAQDFKPAKRWGVV